ncbi:hypothetical protein HYN48_12945 [Flavobacterium magnum]|uniref:Putative auto-transporter adhesin head GIN domain-containing protein n=1 Tax=Flavobacterium magnum TaxID=2162713 RepID=A0A2S0RHB6_9FLAO|nr:DUF2807 domain-containing protein [Flavobacterium magnum]AWA30909.1 hypothetical protein HYN48_12945 [Flavobacterium magnum]
MKTTILPFLLLLCTSSIFSQINGSGNTVSKSYDFTDFDKVSLNDLDGEVTIDIGKTWSVTATIDDNLSDLLQVRLDAREHLLDLSLKGNKDNRLYIENTHIRIAITMPEASVIRHDGNSHVTLSHVNGKYLRIENVSNGHLTASGKVDQLDIVHAGNGNIDARQLNCGQAGIQSDGNGQVIVCAEGKLAATGSGNGDILNTGKAAFSGSSRHQGNGKLIVKPKS